MADLISRMMDLEEGVLSEQDAIELGAELVRTGMAWQLQGSYGRWCQGLIDNKVISDKGEILVGK